MTPENRAENLEENLEQWKTSVTRTPRAAGENRHDAVPTTLHAASRHRKGYGSTGVTSAQRDVTGPIGPGDVARRQALFWDRR